MHLKDFTRCICVIDRPSYDLGTVFFKVVLVLKFKHKQRVTKTYHYQFQQDREIEVRSVDNRCTQSGTGEHYIQFVDFFIF
jgi:hypothetical protein